MPAPNTAAFLIVLVASLPAFLALLLIIWSAINKPICAVAASVFANLAKPAFSAAIAPVRSKLALAINVFIITIGAG